jgi:hypothetical protein
MRVSCRINPEDFLNIQKLLTVMGAIKPWSNKDLRMVNERGVGYIYLDPQEGDEFPWTFGWDQTTRRSSLRDSEHDLRNIYIPPVHTMILDGKEVEVSHEAYNQIQEFISCE